MSSRDCLRVLADGFHDYSAPPLVKMVGLPQIQAYDPQGFEGNIDRILERLSRRLGQINLTFENLLRSNEHILKANDGLMNADNFFRLLYKIQAYVSPKEEEYLIMKYGAGGACFLNVDSMKEDMAKTEARVKHGITKVAQKEDPEDIELYAPDYHFSFGYRQDSQRWRTSKNKEPFSKSIARIRKYVYKFNVQLDMFFAQHDKMNHGKIKKCNFLRALEYAGISETKNIRCGLQMREDELQEIADMYTDQTEKDLVEWKKFVNDIEDVHGPVNLMKMGPVKMQYFSPTPDVRKLDLRLCGQSLCSPQEMSEVSRAMKVIGDKVAELSVDPLPFFLQYDKSRTGYVNFPQFLKAMHQAKIYVTYAEGNSVVKVFSDIQGFPYVKFLSSLGAYANLPRNRNIWPRGDGSPVVKEGYIDNTNGISKKCSDYSHSTPVDFTKQPVIGLDNKSQRTFDDECKSIQLKEAMNIIKYYATTLRLELCYFLEQYDRLRSGFYTEDNFARALNSAYQFPLSRLHYNLLFQRYRHPFQPDLINGKEFLNDIENMERNNEYDMPYFIPPSPGHVLQPLRITRDEVVHLEDIWKRIAANVREFKEWEICKSDLKSPYDTTKSNLVTKERYLKVLDQIHILSILSDKDIDLLYRIYGFDTGVEVKFDLLRFFKHMTQMCQKYRLFPQK